MPSRRKSQAHKGKSGGPLAERLRALQGDLSKSAFARKCGIGESLMRKYLAGSSPSAETLALIARGNDASVEWLVTGEGQRSRSALLQLSSGREYARINRSEQPRAEQPAGSYLGVSFTMLSAALAAVSTVPLMTAEAKRKVAMAWYDLMKGNSSMTDADLLKQFLDAVDGAMEVGREQEVEWPLVDRRHAARRKTDQKP